MTGNATPSELLFESGFIQRGAGEVFLVKEKLERLDKTKRVIEDSIFDNPLFVKITLIIGFHH
ncbi:hypothetical protein PghCCS26_14660 [Paenibacillus glycanilyticus]|uniref:Uncharacterized protein n=1 Tax=Paenibacillus glycanilyticus TaxID=126569 RepID=A0ABQ6NGX0_9BACL|nr:hypothetical protein PghCCS26_14660 [Paenibacillus glycanilyticus]